MKAFLALPAVRSANSVEIGSDTPEHIAYLLSFDKPAVRFSGPRDSVIWVEDTGSQGKIGKFGHYFIFTDENPLEGPYFYGRGLIVGELEDEFVWDAVLFAEIASGEKDNE